MKGEEILGGLEVEVEGVPKEKLFANGAGVGKAGVVPKLKATGAGTGLGCIEEEVLLGADGVPKLKGAAGALAGAVVAAGVPNEIGVASFEGAGVGGAPKLNPVLALATFGAEATGAPPKLKLALKVDIGTVGEGAVAFAGIENRGAASDTFVGVTDGTTGAPKEKGVAVAEGAAGLTSTGASTAAGCAKSKAAAGFAKLKDGGAAFGDTSFDPDPNERGEGVIVLLEVNDIGAILAGSAEILLTATAGTATTGLANSDGSSLMVAGLSVAYNRM